MKYDEKLIRPGTGVIVMETASPMIPKLLNKNAMRNAHK